MIPAFVIDGALGAAGQGSTGEFDFSTLGFTTMLDARVGASITTTGAGVSLWEDQIGSNDASQATDGDRPANGGTVLGENAIVFDRSNTEDLDWRAMTAAGTIFLVGQQGLVSASGNEAFMGSGASGATGPAGCRLTCPVPPNNIFFQLADGTTRIGVNSNVDSLAQDTPFIIGVRWDGTQYGIRVNGAAAANSSHSLGSLGTSTITLGRTFSTTSSFSDIKLIIVLSADTRLDDTNFAAAFTELNNIFGVF